MKKEYDDEIFEKVTPDEDVDDYKFYREAGEIAKNIREKSKQWVKVGARIVDIAEKIEEEIKGHIAFPVNIAINEIAAHYTPEFNDEIVLTDKDIVSIDIGTHVDGFVGGDTAYTIDLTGENAKLIEASEAALNNALSILKAGINTKDIGAEIEKTILKFGFKPVENLCGHGLDRYDVHANFQIPNVKTATGIELAEGEIFAIEPFASNGEGRVREGNTTNIFQLNAPAPVRSQMARDILKLAEEEYLGLPFAERWIAKKFNPVQMKLGLKELLLRQALKGHPVLHDLKGSKVSQAEVTVCLEKDSCEVLT